MVKLRAERLRGLELFADAPREVAVDPGGAVVVPVGVVGEPVIRGRAVSDVGGREQRDEELPARDRPDVRRTVAAAGDEEAAVGRERDGLRALEVAEQL